MFQILFFFLFLFVPILFVSGCSSSDHKSPFSKKNLKGEYIYRHHDEIRFAILEEESVSSPIYPWEEMVKSLHPRITKEYFRCKGCTLNPAIIVKENGKETQRYHDCGGITRHSLPLRDGKEFIYPILIDLLNHIQLKTNKKVVITSGHRCPDHNTYVDASVTNQASKHQIGAEVSLYVIGLENEPEEIIKWVIDFYKTSPKYKGKKEFEEFTRYEKGDTNVSIAPWMNKEVFVKIYSKNEGRNFDNQHLFPYVSIQVRFDVDEQAKVIYTWDKAFRNYLRF